MPPSERDNTPATTDLATLRAEIKQCEDFLAVCERIKKLEKLDESNALPIKINKLQAHINETALEMEVAAKNVQRDETVLNSTDRTIGAHEQEELKHVIKVGKARVKSLQLFIDEEAQQIKRIEQEMQNNSLSLQDLYAQLELAMQPGGFHPNTVGTRLAELRSLEEKFRADRKANIALKNTDRDSSFGVSPPGSDQTARSPSNRIDPRSKANLREPAISERDFRQRLIDDLRVAKKSVVIMSKYLSVEQASKLMPELARLATHRLNVLIYTVPPDLHTELMKLEALSVIASAHQAFITVILRGDIENNAVIIDDLIAWEGGISILGPADSEASMRRVVGSSNARQLRKFISAKPM